MKKMELDDRDLDSGHKHQKHVERLPSVVEGEAPTLK